MTSTREAIERLRRRAEHLEARIADKERCGEGHKTSWDRSELAAIRVALREMARSGS